MTNRLRHPSTKWIASRKVAMGRRAFELVQRVVGKGVGFIEADYGAVPACGVEGGVGYSLAFSLYCGKDCNARKHPPQCPNTHEILALSIGASSNSCFLRFHKELTRRLEEGGA